MNTLSLKSKSPGFTLVELMVAITIGLIILAVLSQVYVGSKRTYRSQEALSRLQENGRYAIDFLGRDLRVAGYMGCIGPGAAFNNIANPISGWTPLNTTTSPPTLEGIIGYEQASVPAAGFPVTPGEVKASTDVVEIQHFSATGAKVTVSSSSSPPPTTANVQIASNPLNFQTSEVLVATDCASVDIFAATTFSSGMGKVTIAHASSNNTSNNTSKPYADNAEIMRIETSVYYIGSGAGVCPLDSLCRTRLGFYVAGGPNFCVNAAAASAAFGFCVEQVAEGVEDMQVLYGVNTTNSPNNTADRFVNAATIATATIPTINCAINALCWAHVVSARVNLLLRTVDATVSPDNLTTYPASQIPLFGGPPLPAITTPRAYRRVYTETVTLRDRAL